MKKNSKAVPAKVEAALKPKGKKVPHKRGRKKEKVQISVRIDQAIMDLAYGYIQTSGARITDLLERGLLLALRESGQLSPQATQGRFVMANAPAERQRKMIGTALLDVFTQVRALTALEACHRDFYLSNAEAVFTWPGAEEGLKILAQPAEGTAIEA